MEIMLAVSTIKVIWVLKQVFGREVNNLKQSKKRHSEPCQISEMELFTKIVNG